MVALHFTNGLVRRVRSQGLAAPLVVATVGLLMVVGLGGRSFYRWWRTDVKHTTLFEMVALGEELRERAPLDTKVAVVWAGALPYFSRLYTIDLLGKSDKVIARSTPHNMSPGHNKWNYEHSIGVLEPDIIVQLWRARKEDIEYVTKLGYSGEPNGMYFRKSPQTYARAVGPRATSQSRLKPNGLLSVGHASGHSSAMRARSSG